MRERRCLRAQGMNVILVEQAVSSCLHVSARNSQSSESVVARIRSSSSLGSVSSADDWGCVCGA